MKAFMDEQFLLETETAKSLYHRYAEKMPIIDYHCHIDPREIAEDRVFDNIAQAWLGGDHYKWRLIRANGVPEEEITGNASDRAKFQHFAEALPKAVGNPVYHWTHLELRRYFGYDGVLNGDTAERVWRHCNDRLRELSVRKIIERSNVETVVTTDDPADDLRWHIALRNDTSCQVSVLPGWRPDRIMNIQNEGFADYVACLGEAAGRRIDSFEDLQAALKARLDYFETLGCRASDHGLDAVVCRPSQKGAADAIFQKALSGEPLTRAEAERYIYELLTFFAREYSERNWVMQLHYGALRNANSAMYSRLGPDAGFDCISGFGDAPNIAATLNELNNLGALPKTVLYSLDPGHNAMLGTVIGCFQGALTPGMLQHGSAWWFNDTKRGMEEQIQTLASLSLLGNFIGMLTDSRSFLSYTRHEYFRRILCNLLGRWVENGELPHDEVSLGGLIRDISYNNIKRYLNV